QARRQVYGLGVAIDASLQRDELRRGQVASGRGGIDGMMHESLAVLHLGAQTPDEPTEHGWLFGMQSRRGRCRRRVDGTGYRRRKARFVGDMDVHGAVFSLLPPIGWSRAQLRRKW